MSETVRSYRSKSRTVTKDSVSLLNGGIRLTRYALLIVLALGVYAYWISRDTRRMEEFVSTDATFRIVAHNLVENRARVQDTTVWSALPESWRNHPLPQLLRTQVGLPEWVQRNLIGQYVLISGTDFMGFSDTIYITKLSRVGSILERMLRFSSESQPDAAGGLSIRHLTRSNLYYATRGRVALLSASRRALIHALTLDDLERVDAEEWDDSIWLQGNEDLRGTVSLEGLTEWGQYFPTAGFALRFEHNTGILKLSLSCADPFYEDFGESLRGGGAPKLPSPVAGPIQLSTNLGGDAAGLWSSLGIVLNAKEEFGVRWTDWTSDTDPKSQASYLAQLLANSGPGVALTWHGMEMDAIIPSHRFSLIAEHVNTDIASELSDLVENPPVEIMNAVYKRVNADHPWIEVVDVGGAARTAIVKPSRDGKRVFVSTSVDLAEQYETDAPRRTYMDVAANVFLRVVPQEIVEHYIAFGEALVLDGLLEGYDAEAFIDRAAELRDTVHGIETITATMVHEDETVNVDIVLKTTQP